MRSRPTPAGWPKPGKALLDGLDASPPALRHLPPSAPMNTCFSSVLQLSAVLEADGARRGGRAARPRLAHENGITEHSKEMCSAPIGVAVAAFAISGKVTATDPWKSVKQFVEGAFFPAEAPRGVIHEDERAASAGASPLLSSIQLAYLRLR